MKRDRQRGFTLVELSIVLVIIGLLIGGILVSKSMIETAKIQNFIRQIQQFDIAVSNFNTKYNGLPGDSSKFGCTGTSNVICDDGLIEDDVYSGASFDGEVANFWPSLQQGGFTFHGKTFKVFTGVYGPVDLNSQTPDSPLVIASIDAGIFVMQCGWDLSKNCYTLYSPDGLETSPLFTPATALAVEAKIDDQNSNGGIIQDYPNAVDFRWNFYGPGGGTDDSFRCEDNSGNYMTGNSGINCYMQILLLSQVGY